MPKEQESILVIDDEETVRSLLQRVLEESGYGVITSSNGYEALERLSKHKSELVLLDIKMPRMDGIEVLKIIRSDDKFKTIPVVMLTSSCEEPDLKKCYEIGVNAYVVKPVNFKDFFEVVKQLGVFWALLNELPPQKIL